MSTLCAGESSLASTGNFCFCAWLLARFVGKLSFKDWSSGPEKRLSSVLSRVGLETFDWKLFIAWEVDNSAVASGEISATRVDSFVSWKVTFPTNASHNVL